MDAREGRKAMDILIARLPSAASATVDAPLRDDGVWWADVTLGAVHEVVGWYPGKGYAMSSSPETFYGENPDVWVTDPDAAASTLLRIIASRGPGTGLAANP